MRAVAALFLASTVTACDAVPDLRFAADTDASGGDLPDATLPTQPASDGGGAPKLSGDGGDASPVGTQDASADGPSPPPPDAGPPGPCAGQAPAGITCCGDIVCRPNLFNGCDCQACESKCTSSQVCCMDKNGKFQQCAATTGACPKP